MKPDHPRQLFILVWIAAYLVVSNEGAIGEGDNKPVNGTILPKRTPYKVFIDKPVEGSSSVFEHFKEIYNISGKTKPSLPATNASHNISKRDERSRRRKNGAQPIRNGRRLLRRFHGLSRQRDDSHVVNVGETLFSNNNDFIQDANSSELNVPPREQVFSTTESLGDTTVLYPTTLSPKRIDSIDLKEKPPEEVLNHNSSASAKGVNKLTGLIKTERIHSLESTNSLLPLERNSESTLVNITNIIINDLGTRRTLRKEVLAKQIHLQESNHNKSTWLPPNSSNSTSSQKAVPDESKNATVLPETSPSSRNTSKELFIPPFENNKSAPETNTSKDLSLIPQLKSGSSKLASLLELNVETLPPLLPNRRSTPNPYYIPPKNSITFSRKGAHLAKNYLETNERNKLSRARPYRLNSSDFKETESPQLNNVTSSPDSQSTRKPIEELFIFLLKDDKPSSTNSSKDLSILVVPKDSSLNSPPIPSTSTIPTPVRISPVVSQSPSQKPRQTKPQLGIPKSFDSQNAPQTSRQSLDLPPISQRTRTDIFESTRLRPIDPLISAQQVSIARQSSPNSSRARSSEKVVGPPEPSADAADAREVKFPPHKAFHDFHYTPVRIPRPTPSYRPSPTPTPYRPSPTPTRYRPSPTPTPYRPSPTPTPYRPSPTPTPYRPSPTPTRYRPSPTPTPYRPSPTPTPYRPSPTPTRYRPSLTPTPYRPSPTPTPYRPSPTPTRYRPSPTPTPYRPSPTPTRYRPSPTPTPYRPSPTPTRYRPSPTPTPYRPSPTPTPYRPSPTPTRYRPSPTPTPYRPSPTPTPYRPTDTPDRTHTPSTGDGVRVKIPGPPPKPFPPHSAFHEFHYDPVRVKTPGQKPPGPQQPPYLSTPPRRQVTPSPPGRQPPYQQVPGVQYPSPRPGKTPDSQISQRPVETKPYKTPPPRVQTTTPRSSPRDRPPTDKIGYPSIGQQRPISQQRTPPPPKVPDYSITQRPISTGRRPTPPPSRGIYPSPPPPSRGIYPSPPPPSRGIYPSPPPPSRGIYPSPPPIVQQPIIPEQERYTRRPAVKTPPPSRGIYQPSYVTPPTRRPPAPVTSAIKTTTSFPVRSKPPAGLPTPRPSPGIGQPVDQRPDQEVRFPPHKVFHEFHSLPVKPHRFGTTTRGDYTTPPSVPGVAEPDTSFSRRHRTTRPPTKIVTERRITPPYHSTPRVSRPPVSVKVVTDRSTQPYTPPPYVTTSLRPSKKFSEPATPSRGKATPTKVPSKPPTSGYQTPPIRGGTTKTPTTRAPISSSTKTIRFPQHKAFHEFHYSPVQTRRGRREV